jgi:hypothetical protein
MAAGLKFRAQFQDAVPRLVQKRHDVRYLFGFTEAADAGVFEELLLGFVERDGLAARLVIDS